jgi:hypothetical protein
MLARAQMVVRSNLTQVTLFYYCIHLEILHNVIISIIISILFWFWEELIT